MFGSLRRLLFGNLRKQLTVGIVLVVSTMISLFVWDMTRRQQAVEMDQHSQQVMALANSTATSSAVWVISRDFSGLQEIIQGILRYPDVRHAIVLDLRGQVLAHNDRTKIGLYLSDLPQKPGASVLQQTTSSIDVTSPVMLADRQIGWVRIGLDRAQFNAQLTQIRRNGILYVLIGAVLSALIGSLAGRYLIRRLSAIQQVANAVQAGESGLRVVLSGDDEAAQLARQFNSMMDSLAQRQATLKESEERYRNLIDWTPEAIAVNRDGKVVYVNPAAIGLMGAGSARELLGKPFLDFFHQDFRESVLARVQRQVDEGATVPMADEKFVKLDGTAIDVEVRPTSVIYEGAPAIQVSIRDITERKHAENELKRSNAELEQFSYAISHDMRQPLRMISGHLTLLKKSIADRLDAEQRESFKFAIDGAKRMDAMMVGLLEYSRVGHKGEPAVWTESRGLLDEALLFLQPAIAETQANVSIEGDWPKILVSSDEVLRLMQNLVSNALKFRVAGRAPEVRVIGAFMSHEWRVSVTDNGIGILPDQIGRLFQVFQRLQSRTDYEGTGLGLAMCRKIVEHHNGRIWAESAGENQGCSFIFTLPIAEEA